MSRATFGNTLLLMLLAMIFLGAAVWQRDPWWLGTPGHGRQLFALLAVIGWLGASMYMWRPKSSSSAIPDAGTSASETAGDEVLVVWASQTGLAAELAEHTARSLQQAGVQHRLLPADAFGPGLLQRHRRLLFIASTTGEGDPPDHAHGLLRALQDSDLSEHAHAVLALGDCSYANFCEFGKQLDDALQHRGSTPLFERIDVDRAAPAALQRWQAQVSEHLCAGCAGDWRPSPRQPWTLIARRCMNPGSVGAPVHRLQLESPGASEHEWQAGDIAEVAPRNAPQRIAEWLDATNLQGTAEVHMGTGSEHRKLTLANALARSLLPDPADVIGCSEQALAVRLQPLPHREYSIASVPAEGTMQLLVRLQCDSDGHPGLGSGWLCLHAAIGDSIDLRIRRNPGFHAPDPATPLILIGNGTGIAGLRAHIAARAHAPDPGNTWLLFGERQSAHDLHFRDDLQRWQDNGVLHRMDLTFSRDGGGLRYVQDAVRANRQRLRRWVDDGACILICGSAQGMAPAVDAQLGEILGDDLRQQLLREARYRRDVY